MIDAAQLAFAHMTLQEHCWLLPLQGTVADPRYPYAILSVLCLVGAMCATLMPETLNQKLPETVQDAAHFGRDQKFWSLAQTKTNKEYERPPAIL